MSIAFHPLDPRGARLRLAIAAVLGAAAWLATPGELSSATRGLIGWDVGGLAMLALGLSVTRGTHEATRKRAAARDPGRTFVWLIVLASSAISLFAATFVVHQAAALPAGEGRVLLVLCVTTVLVSWLLTHTAFTLRYAHLYYRAGREEEGGLAFPGKQHPDDLDFAYFAFTIGMCFQVSDVTVTNRVVRRTALGHALLSFAYNTVVLALVVNLIVGHLG
jgi:uncharacterized membrane protein